MRESRQCRDGRGPVEAEPSRYGTLSISTPLLPGLLGSRFTERWANGCSLKDTQCRFSTFHIDTYPYGYV